MGRGCVGEEGRGCTIIFHLSHSQTLWGEGTNAFIHVVLGRELFGRRQFVNLRFCRHIRIVATAMYSSVCTSPEFMKNSAPLCIERSRVKEYDGWDSIELT